MRERKALLQEMLIDEEDVLQNVVEKAKQVFRIDKNGSLVFLHPRNSLTHQQQIALVLLARRFASELGMADSDTMTAEQLAETVDPDKASVSARLTELKKEAIVESPSRAHFRISILGVQKILDEILAAE